MKTRRIRNAFFNIFGVKRRRTYLIWICCVLITLTLVSTSLNIPTEFKQPPEVKDDRFSVQIYYTPAEDMLFPLNHSFILSNIHVCQQTRPYLIAVVPSREGNFKQRQAIRETYGTISRDKVAKVNGVAIEHVVRFVFVVGASDDYSVEMNIFKENNLYRDIVQVDMVDSYYNLTLKVLMALKWVDKYCPSAKYVLKVDDDVFVHVGILLNQIHSVRHSIHGNVFGKVYNMKKHFVVERGDSKWATSREEYPLNKYPIYAQGTSYTLTSNLVPHILHKAPYLPYLHNEDVFITGVIAGQILGAELVDLNKTSNWELGVEPVPCLFAEDHELARSEMRPDLMYKTWRALQENEIYCRLFRGRRSWC